VVMIAIRPVDVGFAVAVDAVIFVDDE